MKKKLFTILTIVEIIIIVFVGYDLFINRQPPEDHLKNWETETNLPVIGHREYYDAVFLGTSHARVFTRFQNHERVQNVLGKTFINFGQGYERGGVQNQQMYLKYFYARRNFANTLVYIVDPFIFFRKNIDASEKLYINEPYRDDFYNLLKEENVSPKIVDFYATKDSKGIMPTEYPEFYKNYQESQFVPNEGALNDRVTFLYQDEYNQKQFDQTLATMMETVKFAKEQGMRVVIIIPTTQLPTQDGDKRVHDALKEKSKSVVFEFYDYSHIITDPHLYYDTDHLNTKGILLFTKKYLKPILNK